MSLLVVVGLSVVGCGAIGGSEYRAGLFNWDPCAFVSPEMFADVAAKDGSEPRVAIEPDEFTSCKARITLPGSGSKELAVAVAYSAEAGNDQFFEIENYTTREVGSWTLAERPGDGESCSRALYSEVGTVHLQASSSAGRIDLCEMVDKPTAELVRQLTIGGVARISYPDDSQGAVDLCAALPHEDVVEILPRFGSKSPSSLPAHSCTWMNVDGIEIEQILFGAHLGTGASQIGNDVEIAGRRSTVAPLGSGGCSVSTSGKTWQTWPGKRHTDPGLADPGSLFEHVSLTVDVIGAGPDENCRLATSLAEVAWPALP